MRHLLASSFALLALALALPTAQAQEAWGAGTRPASTQASAKPGLKKETPAPDKADATEAASQDACASKDANGDCLDANGNKITPKAP